MRTAWTDPHTLAEARYPFAEVEPALAAALDIDAAHRTLFRSRLKHFQRIGVLGVRPGRGTSFRYGYEQVARLAVVLLIADIGLDPALTVQSVNQSWERNLRRRVWQAVEPGTRDAENPWFLTLRVEAMRGPWFKQSAIAAIGVFQRFHVRRPLSEKERAVALAKVSPEHHEAWLANWDAPQENIDMWLDHPEERSFSVFALSHVLHRLKDHLDREEEKP